MKTSTVDELHNIKALIPDMSPGLSLDTFSREGSGHTLTQDSINLLPKQISLPQQHQSREGQRKNTKLAKAAKKKNQKSFKPSMPDGEEDQVVI